jgi:hypothetical protein
MLVKSKEGKAAPIDLSKISAAYFIAYLQRRKKKGAKSSI